MKKAFLLLVLVAAGCGSPGSSSGTVVAPVSSAVPVTPVAPVATSSTPAPVSTAAALLPQALAARAAFLATFWDPAQKDYFKYDDHHAALFKSAYSDFWWGAHLLETTLDAYAVTGDPRERQLVDDHYDGFTATHDWEANAFNDDLCWWALALARAYETTGEDRFRDRAATIFQSIAAFEDQSYGGGVWWKRDGTGPGKNVCINAPYVLLALHLHAWTGDPGYLDRAKNVQAWMTANLTSGATVDDNVNPSGLSKAQLTYNYGTFLGASLGLYDATLDPSYLAAANAAADHAIATLTVNGVLKDEGQGDGSGFKMILTRYLVSLARHGEPRIAAFLAANADTAWNHRRADGLMDHDWTQPAPATAIDSFAAASAVSVQLQAILALAPAPAAPGRTAPPAFANVRVTADKGTRHGLTLEAKYAGFMGTGYVAGWNQIGESIDFAVSVPAAGRYVVAFHYAAGAGDALRIVSANGAFSLASFPGSTAWTDYRTTSTLLTLKAGANVVSVAYDLLSSNYLNLDAITVAPSPAR